MQYIDKKKVIALLIVLCVIIGVGIFYGFNKEIESIQFGDQVGIFNSIDEQGNEMQSVIAIYDSDFKDEKKIIKLDEIFYSVDQLNWSRDDGATEEVTFRAYNENDYQDITINLKDESVSKSDVVKESYVGDDKMELNVYPNGDFEIVKPDSYMIIKDPNLNIDGNYFSLSDATQLTNYVIY